MACLCGGSRSVTHDAASQRKAFLGAAARGSSTHDPAFLGRACFVSLINSRMPRRLSYTIRFLTGRPYCKPNQ